MQEKNIVGTTTNLVTGETPVGQFATQTAKTMANQAVGNQLTNAAEILGKGGSFLGGLRSKLGIKKGIGIPEMLGGSE